MPIYHIELSKHIVVSIDADTEEDARSQAAEPDYNDDGAWDRAEAQVIDVLHIDHDN